VEVGLGEPVDVQLRRMQTVEPREEQGSTRKEQAAGRRWGWERVERECAFGNGWRLEKVGTESAGLVGSPLKHPFSSVKSGM
jgi:hypothetical protein